MLSKRDLQTVYQLLGGEPVLLAIRPRSKKPFQKRWEEIEYSDTEDLIYQESLLAGNLGVRLGALSQLEEGGVIYHLLSVDVDSDEGAEAFREINRWTDTSLVTKGARGLQFWVWVEPPYYDGEGEAGFVKLYHLADPVKWEKDPKRPWGEWRIGAGKSGAQTVIMGEHPDGVAYQIINRHPPARLRFEDIRFPDTVWVPWKKSPWEDLVDAHGLPWSGLKRKTFNPPFLVGKFALENPVIYEGTEGRFYHYREERGLWEPVSDDFIKKQFSDDLYAMAVEHKVPQLLGKRTDAFLGSLKNQLKGYVEKRDVFKPHRGLIHFKNCMVQLAASNPEEDESFEPGVYEFDQAFYSRNQIDFDFDPDASWKNTLFMRFMEEQLDAPDIEYLQKMFGSLLLGYNPSHSIVILEGKGGTGKSTFVYILNRILGDNNIRQLRTKHLDDRFEIAMYVGRKWLLGSEVPSNFLHAEGAEAIKALTGEDLLSAEFKGSNETVNVRGNFNVWCVTNTRLRIRLEGDSDAYLRRVGIVRFLRYPSSPDPLLKEKIISSEASAVINWGLRGAHLLLEDMKASNGGKLRLTKEFKERTESLLAESDSVRYFVRHGVMKAPGKDVTVNELNSAYVKFCEERGWYCVTTRVFSRQIVDRIAEIYRVGSQNGIKRDDKAQRGFINLDLRPEKPAEDEGSTNAIEQF